jgi:AcrR family transcriptional regulator
MCAIPNKVGAAVQDQRKRTRRVHDKRAKDRRVQKTRALLLEALGSLIHEKPYDAIVVKEILDRANVGRSTFYTHFRDKDELLVTGIHDLLRPAPAASSASRSECVVRFALPIFEHIDQQRRTAGNGRGVPGQALVHERLRRVLADRIAADLGASPERQGPAPRGLPVKLLVQYVASSFILVLDWWVGSRDALSPAEVDRLFRAMVLPTLEAALD